MTHLWHAQGLMELGFRVTEEALTRAGTAAPPRLRGRALGDAAYLSCALGRYEETAAYSREKLAIAQAEGDLGGASIAHYWLGAVAVADSDWATARKHLEDAVALSREEGELGSLAGSLSGLADVVRGAGDLDAARSLYQEALGIFRAKGERHSLAITLINLAIVAIAYGERERPCELLREASAVAVEIGSLQVEQLVVEILAQLMVSRGDWERATRLDATAAARLEQMGLRRSPVDEQSRTKSMGKARTALGAAQFDAAEAAGRAASFGDALAEAREWLGATPIGA
jgi:tetratricopeptide (TPR) repeat protein